MTCAKGSPIGPLLAEHAFALILSLTRGIASKRVSTAGIAALTKPNPPMS